MKELKLSHLPPTFPSKLHAAVAGLFSVRAESAVCWARHTRARNSFSSLRHFPLYSGLWEETTGKRFTLSSYKQYCAINLLCVMSRRISRPPRRRATIRNHVRCTCARVHFPNAIYHPIVSPLIGSFFPRGSTYIWLFRKKKNICTHTQLYTRRQARAREPMHLSSHALACAITYTSYSFLFLIFIGIFSLSTLVFGILKNFCTEIFFDFTNFLYRVKLFPP